MENLISTIDNKLVKHNIAVFANELYNSFLKDSEIYYDVLSKEDLDNIVESLGKTKRVDYFVNYFKNINFDTLSFLQTNQMTFIKNPLEDPLLKYYNCITKNETNITRQQKMMQDLQKYETSVEKCYIFTSQELSEFKQSACSLGTFMIHYDDKLHKIEYYVITLTVMYCSLIPYQKECLLKNLSIDFKKKGHKVVFEKLDDFLKLLNEDNYKVYLNTFVSFMLKMHNYHLIRFR